MEQKKSNEITYIRRYCITFLYPLVISESKAEELITDLFNSVQNLHSMEVIKYQGIKPLSILIKKHSQAHVFSVYFVMYDNNDLGKAFKEFNRILGLNTVILRYMIQRVLHNQIFTLENNESNFDEIELSEVKTSDEN